MRQPRIGLVGLMQANFGGDKEGFYARCVKELKQLSEEMSFEFFPFTEGIYSNEKAEEAVKFMKEKQVDFLMIQNSSFASGNYISILTKVKAYLGLWALPEPGNEGSVLLNSFCGINMNAAIIKNYLKDNEIKYKWFYGYTENPLFINRFKLTVKALRGIIGVRGARIAAIGGIAPGFSNLYYDERNIQKKFGVSIDRNPAFDDIKTKALGYSAAEVKNAIDEILTDTPTADNYAEASLDKHARVYKAYCDLVQENKYDAIASICWPDFRTKMDMVPCAAFARLNDYQVPVACEGDILSAISMLLLKKATGIPSILMDLVEFDTDDNSLFLWHCGVGSKHYARSGVQLKRHFNPGPYSKEKGWPVMAPVAAMEFKKGFATVMGFMDDGDRMMVFSGEFIDKPCKDGSSGWLGDLHFNGKTGNVLDLVNTIMYHGYHHHYPLVWGENTDLLSEIGYWLDIQTIETMGYKDNNSI